MWLSKIFNTIANLEAIPSIFKEDILIPIYKGKGKDPFIPTSYRGITLTSVFAKTLELLLLNRTLPILRDRNIPQLTQTAYQCGVSCADATFACQETISKFIRDGDSVYSGFYDLASAFDTVEYPVLLSHLKNSGISGRPGASSKIGTLIYTHLYKLVKQPPLRFPSAGVSVRVQCYPPFCSCSSWTLYSSSSEVDHMALVSAVSS